MTRNELASNIMDTSAESSSNGETDDSDKNELLKKYIELNDACDKILARIKKQSKNRRK